MKIRVGEIYRGVWANDPAWLGVQRITRNSQGHVKVQFSVMQHWRLPRWAWGICHTDYRSATEFCDKVREAGKTVRMKETEVEYGPGQ